MYNFLSKIIFFNLLYICLNIKNISSQHAFFLGILYSLFFKKNFVPKNIYNITNLLLKIFSNLSPKDCLFSSDILTLLRFFVFFIRYSIYSICQSEKMFHVKHRLLTDTKLTKNNI